MLADPSPTFVSRGGLKLHHALTHFNLEVTAFTCVDLGCSTGGFTDCLLQHGAARVHAVDTAYGELAWKLRQDPRVVVHERSNALHLPPAAAVDLAVADLSWTPQRLLIPAALRWLAPAGRLVSLIKPHYELKELHTAGITGAWPAQLPRGGVLPEAAAQAVADAVALRLPSFGVRVLGLTLSPILGGSAKSSAAGNREFLALLQPA